MRGSARGLLLSTTAHGRGEDDMVIMTGMAIDDGRLVVDYARHGDEGALEELVLRHHAPAYRLALRLLGEANAAEDAASEALVDLIRAAPRFDPERPFGPWWSTLLLNPIRRSAR